MQRGLSFQYPVNRTGMIISGINRLPEPKLPKGYNVVEIHPEKKYHKYTLTGMAGFNDR